MSHIFKKRKQRSIEITKSANSWLNGKVEFKPRSARCLSLRSLYYMTLFTIGNYHTRMVEEAAW